MWLSKECRFDPRFFAEDSDLDLIRAFRALLRYSSLPKRYRGLFNRSCFPKCKPNEAHTSGGSIVLAILRWLTKTSSHRGLIVFGLPTNAGVATRVRRSAWLGSRWPFGWQVLHSTLAIKEIDMWWLLPRLASEFEPRDVPKASVGTRLVVHAYPSLTYD